MYMYPVVMHGMCYVLEGELNSEKVRCVLVSMCAVPYGNRACSGGSVETSLMYVIDVSGLDTEEYYPYKERVSPLINAAIISVPFPGFQQYLCKFSKKYAVGKCTGGQLSLKNLCL